MKIKKNELKAVKYLLITFFIGITSCSSRDGDEVSDDQTNVAVLTVRVNGVNDEDITSLAATAKNNLSGNVNSGSMPEATETMVSGNNFDALMSFRSLPNKSGVLSMASSSQLSEKITNPKAATNPLPANIQYRILIYDSTGNTLLNNVTAITGANLNIQVDGLTRYKWVAFSVNGTSVPNVSNGKVLASDLTNKDVLYANGVIDTQTGQNYLNIIFRHITTRIDVDVDTRGLFGSINTFNSLQVGTGTGSQFTSLINAADLDVLSGSFGSPMAVAAARTAVNIANKDVSTGDLVKTISIYTVIPSGTNVTAGSLTMQPIFSTNLDQTIAYPPSVNLVGVRPYGNSNTYLIFRNPAFSPIAGNRYQLSSRIIESPVKVSGISWARSDLWYDGTAGQIDRYRFKADAGVPPYNTGNQNEYWNWKATTPTGTPGSGDPCALVYPLGLWRMPTDVELATLGNKTSYEYYGFPGGSSQQADTYKWYAVINQTWDADSGAPSSLGNYSGYSDKVIFTFNGYFTTNTGTVINSRTQVDSRSNISANYTVSMGYWSGTSYDASNATSVIQNATVRYTGPYNYTNTYGSRSLTAYAKTMGFNIRCVRA